MIKTYEHHEKEYIALRCAAAALECASPNGTEYRVEDVYFDFGQGWMWTTIVAHKKDGSNWPALNPRDHELIVSCDINRIAEAVKNIVNSKFNPDK